MKYIINNTGIVLFKNKPIKIEKTDYRFSRIIEALDLPVDEQEQVIMRIIENKSPVDTPLVDTDDFKFDGDDVYLEGEKLPPVLSKKIKSLHEQDIPISIFKNFWKNLRENPSQKSVEELYDFLEYKELPITEDGCFLAYKGVHSDFYSVNGNADTVIVKGKKNDNHQIYNGVGEKIEVLRRNVNDDRTVHCSTGLHLGSLDYAQGFASTLVVVKVNPRDVVSVPDDFNCQKCRVCAYEVVSLFGQEITSAATTSNGEKVPSNVEKRKDEFENRISEYIQKQLSKGESSVSVRKIQNSFSPQYPSKARVLTALDSLGYFWCVDEDGVLVVSLED